MMREQLQHMLAEKMAPNTIVLDKHLGMHEYRVHECAYVLSHIIRYVSVSRLFFIIDLIRGTP